MPSGSPSSANSTCSGSICWWLRATACWWAPSSAPRARTVSRFRSMGQSWIDSGATDEPGQEPRLAALRPFAPTSTAIGEAEPEEVEPRDAVRRNEHPDDGRDRQEQDAEHRPDSRTAERPVPEPRPPGPIPRTAASLGAAPVRRISRQPMVEHPAQAPRGRQTIKRRQGRGQPKLPASRSSRDGRWTAPLPLEVENNRSLAVREPMRRWPNLRPASPWVVLVTGLAIVLWVSVLTALRAPSPPPQPSMAHPSEPSTPSVTRRRAHRRRIVAHGGLQIVRTTDADGWVVLPDGFGTWVAGAGTLARIDPRTGATRVTAHGSWDYDFARLAEHGEGTIYVTSGRSFSPWTRDRAP